jgi:hypothetical protein
MKEAYKELDIIKDLMENGNWTSGIEKFQQLNCSAKEYTEYLDEQLSSTIEDFALLGFYSRKTIFDKE